MVSVKNMGIPVETIVKDMPFEITHFINQSRENSSIISILACNSYISNENFIIWIRKVRIDPYITNNFFFQIIVNGVYYSVKIEINNWKETYPNFRWKELSPPLNHKNIMLLAEITGLENPLINCIQGFLSNKIDNLINSGV